MGEIFCCKYVKFVGFEIYVWLEIFYLGFILSGIVDWIDCDENGNLLIYDYKIGIFLLFEE